jgi:hypothetical protein
VEQAAVTDDRLLTLDEAYRATFHFIAQYYEREPIEPFLLMLHSMTAWSPGGSLRQTSDPATWDDWIKSVGRAIASDEPLEIPGSFTTE